MTADKKTVTDRFVRVLWMGVICVLSNTAIAQYEPGTVTEVSGSQNALVEQSSELPTPALWRLSDEDTTIYLFGTLHVTKPGRFWFSDTVAEAFESSDVVYFERDVTEPSHEIKRIVQETYYNPDGVTLSSYLNDTEEALVRNAALTNGVSWDALEKMMPWRAASTLGDAALTRQGVDEAKGIEDYLTREAAQTGKLLRGIVSNDVQLRYLAGLSIEAQVGLLIHGIKQDEEDPDHFDAIYDAWITGNADGMAETLIADYPEVLPEVYTVLMKDRNRLWAEMFESLLQEEAGVFFVAVGAGHLVGPDSVQRFLEERGLETERIRDDSEGSAAAGSTAERHRAERHQAADAAWMSLTRSHPVQSIPEHASSYERFLYEYEREASRFRDEGTAFWSSFPEDERRYLWLMMTRAFEPSYAVDTADWVQKAQLPVANDSPVDATAIEDWLRRCAAMREEFWNSPAVDDRQRRLLMWLEAKNALLYARDARARGEAVDEGGVIDSVVRYAEVFGNPVAGDRKSRGGRRNLNILARMIVYRDDIVALDQQRIDEFGHRLKAIEPGSYTGTPRAADGHGYASVLGQMILDGELRRAFMPESTSKLFESRPDFLSGSTGDRWRRISVDGATVEALIYHIIDYPSMRAAYTPYAEAVTRLTNLTNSLAYREVGLHHWDNLSSEQRYHWAAFMTFTGGSVVYPNGIVSWLFDERGLNAGIDFDRTRDLDDRSVKRLDELIASGNLTSQRSANISGLPVMSAARLIRHAENSQQRAYFRNTIEDRISRHFARFGKDDEYARNAVSSAVHLLIRQRSKLGYLDEELGSVLMSYVTGADDALDNTIGGLLQREPLEIGNTIVFRARNFDGEEVSTEQFAGSYVLVDHWDTDCAPCIADFPEMHRIYREFRDRGVEVFSIAYDGTSRRSRVENIKNRLGLTWDTYDGEGLWGGVAARYDLSGFPQYMLLDRKGRLIATTDELRPTSRVRSILEERLALEAQ